MPAARAYTYAIKSKGGMSHPADAARGGMIFSARTPAPHFAVCCHRIKLRRNAANMQKKNNNKIIFLQKNIILLCGTQTTV